MPEGTVIERLASKENGQGPGLTFEEEAELRQFLKIAKPTWSGGNDLTRVIEKLKGIGVTDVDDLLKRVTTNRINEDFTDAGFPRFSQDTLESIRKQSSFVRAMEALTEANFRQTGRFAPVPQLLSKKSIRPAKDPASSSRSTPLRPKSEPAGLSASRSEGVGSRHLSSRGGVGSPPPGMRVATAPTTSQPSPWDQEHFPMPPFGEESGREDPSDRWGHDLFVGARYGTPGSRSAAFLEDDALPLTPVRLRHTTCPTRERHSYSASFLDLHSPFQEVADPWSMPEEPSRRSSNRSIPGARPDSPPQSLSRNGSDLSNTCPGRHGSNSFTPERARRPMSGTAVSVSESPPRRSSASPLEDDEEEDLAHQVSHLRHQVHQICSQGSEMRNGTGAAAWRALRDSSSLLYQAEEMLQEQNDLDERKNLVRLMDKEGLVSPLRKIIAGNVRERLKQENQEGDAEMETLDIHQRCTNIRKQIGEMANSRRELSMLRRAVEAGKDLSQVKLDPEVDDRKQKKRDPKARDPDQVQIRSRKHVQQEGAEQAKKKEQLKDSLRRHLHAESRPDAKEIWANARRKINARLGTSVSAARLRASLSPGCRPGSSAFVPSHLKQDQMRRHEFMAQSVVSSMTEQLGQKKQWTIPDVLHEASEEDGATSEPSTPGLLSINSVRRPSQAPRRTSTPGSRRPSINASQPVLSSKSENPHKPWLRSPSTSPSGTPKRSSTSRTTALSNALGDAGSSRSLKRMSMARASSTVGLSEIAEY